MDRTYRRPGVSRSSDDLLAHRPLQQGVQRISRRARQGTLERLAGRAFKRGFDTSFDASTDKRFALRQPADERPFEARCDGEQPQVVWLEDVSRTGMRF